MGAEAFSRNLKKRISPDVTRPTRPISIHHAQGRWIYQAHEALHRAGRYLRHLGGLQGGVCQETVGLPQGEKPPGPGEQAVLHSRQEDGEGLWHREVTVFLHDQVSVSAPDSLAGPGMILSSQWILEVSDVWFYAYL